MGQACNFKCKNCGNLAPYSLPQRLRYPLEEILRDLDTLFAFEVHVATLQIQGGEPFCYSDLSELLDYLGVKKQAGQIDRLHIATNGSLMPSDEVLAKIKKFDALVRISDYNVASDKAKALKEKCKALAINYVMYDFAKDQGQWYNLGGVETQRESDDGIVEQRFQQCQFNVCLTLEHGELAYCSRAVNASLLQGFDGKAGAHFIIADKANTKEALRNYLTNKHFMEACRYCNGTDDDSMIPPAIQL